nr:MAG TPA: hypothetical protein [Caudoviricetes sp.]
MKTQSRKLECAFSYYNSNLIRITTYLIIKLIRKLRI